MLKTIDLSRNKLAAIPKGFAKDCFYYIVRSAIYRICHQHPKCASTYESYDMICRMVYTCKNMESMQQIWKMFI